MIEARLLENAALVERAIAAYYAECDTDFAPVCDAQKYALFARAKRVRPTLVLECCRLFGGADEAALPYAVAVEMLHTYSLIHDDLPCMDDDDLRRGQPSCHVAFGEAVAVLAGDALLTRAFAVLAGNTAVSPQTTRDAVSVLARAAGDHGMIGGQMMDLASEGTVPPLSHLEKLHANKTGALIVACAELGALAAGLSQDDERTRAVSRYAARIGLAFQILDDVLDATADEVTLGKTVRSDEKEQKATFLSHYTVQEALARARALTAEAKREIAHYPSAQPLLALADYLERRSY